MNPYAFKRHSNPVSGWLRLASYAFLAFALYLHIWWLLVIVIGFMTLNPAFFKEAANKDNWMTKAMLGEERWLKEGKKEGLPAVINIVNTFAFFLLIYVAIDQQLIPTVILTLTTIGLKLWFLSKMV